MYTKIDRLADAYSKATDKASFLAAAWTDLTATEGDALMQAIDNAVDCPHRAEQNMGGACEACTAA